MGGEMHKLRMEENTGEEGWYGAIKSPNWQLSDIHLFITLLSNTMGGI